MIKDLFDPIIYVLKGLLRCAIISQDDTLSPFVVSLGDGPEPLLTSSVPHLNLNALTIKVECVRLEIDAYKSVHVFLLTYCAYVRSLEGLSDIRAKD